MYRPNKQCAVANTTLLYFTLQEGFTHQCKNDIYFIFSAPITKTVKYYYWSTFATASS